jgi:hypothetical protein
MAFMSKGVHLFPHRAPLVSGYYCNSFENTLCTTILLNQIAGILLDVVLCRKEPSW